MFTPMTKVEVECLGAQRDLIDAGMFVSKHRCAALVVAPAAVQAAIVDRSTRRDNYPIIAAVDFPSGRAFALDKMRDVPEDMFQADGFEVVLSVGRGGATCKNELHVIAETLKRYNSVADIRFVLNFFDRDDEEVAACCEECRVQTPQFVRLEAGYIPRTAAVVAAAAGEVHKRTATPIKVSGPPEAYWRANHDCLTQVEAILRVQGVGRIGLALSAARAMQRAAQAAAQGVGTPVAEGQTDGKAAQGEGAPATVQAGQRGLPRERGA
jgi:deoxyribose-phosphate aldolase